MVIALIVMLYKLRHANLFNFFIARCFIVFENIYKYLLAIIIIQVALSYSFKVIFDIYEENID